MCTKCQQLKVALAHRVFPVLYGRWGEEVGENDLSLPTTLTCYSTACCAVIWCRCKAALHNGIADQGHGPGVRSISCKERAHLCEAGMHPPGVASGQARNIQMCG